jgi:hypothetical protein
MRDCVAASVAGQLSVDDVADAPLEASGLVPHYSFVPDLAHDGIQVDDRVDSIEGSAS